MFLESVDNREWKNGMEFLHLEVTLLEEFRGAFYNIHPCQIVEQKKDKTF
jgi:hypothetical protein